MIYGLKIITSTEEIIYFHETQKLMSSLLRNSVAVRIDSPFVILAGERSVHKLSDGRWITNVIYDNDQRHLSSTLSVDLIR